MNITATIAKQGAAAFYRIIQPLMTATSIKGTNVAIVGHNATPDDYKRAVPLSDVVIFQSPQMEWQAEHVEWLSQDPSTLVVIEHDDNIWEIDPLNEAYRTLGTKEVRLDNGEYLWKDGEAGFDLKRNVEQLEIFNRCVKGADVVTSTTPQIAGLLAENSKRLGGNATGVALPNCVDIDMWEPVEIVKPKDEVRIMWQGGDSHYRDYQMVGTVLETVLKKHKNAKLVLVGLTKDQLTSLLKKLPKEQVIVDSPWTSYDAHPYRMKLTGADIGICPLVETPFSRCKSELKYTEYSALGLPTVASNVMPYNEVILDGETGLLASNEEEWEKHLSALVKSATLRRQLGANSRKWVLASRNAKTSAHLWIDAYQTALEEKKKNHDKQRPNSNSSETA